MAVGVARSPVKKSSLLTEQNEEVLTPKEKMAQRKKLRADMEAEKLKQEISQNYKERRKRFNEHKKKQVCQFCRSLFPRSPVLHIYSGQDSSIII